MADTETKLALIDDLVVNFRDTIARGPQQQWSGLIVQAIMKRGVRGHVPPWPWS